MATFYTDPSITMRGLQQPDILSTYVRLMQLKAMAEDQKLRQIQGQFENARLQQLQQLQGDTAAQRSAMAAGVSVLPGPQNESPTAPGLEGILGANTKTFANAPGPQVSFDRSAALQSLAQSNPSLVPGMQQDFASQDAAHQKSMLELAEKATTLDEKQLKNMKTRVDMMGSLAQSVLINPNSYPSAKAMAEKLGLVQPGRLPEQFTPQMIPQLQMWAKQSVDVKDLLTQEETRRHNMAMENKPVSGGAADDKRYEDILTRQNLGQKVTEQEKAFTKAYERRKTLGPITSAALGAPGKEAARLDKGYQFATGQLSSVSKPIQDALDRVSRLTLSINERTPQADSLIAPELLTAMAGGMGSGLRMNEAEISRIVGGRTNLEGIKAAVNKWRTDPSKGLSITDAQRSQIQSLIQKRFELLQKKAQVLNEAQDRLIDASDVESQRRILADAKRKLSTIDEGGLVNAQKVGDRKTFPNGSIGEWDGKGWVQVQAPR